MSDSQLIESLR